MRTFLGLDRWDRRRTTLADDPTSVSLRRIRTALVGLILVIGLGTVGYLVLPVTSDGSRFTLLDALYQTVTTVATVGFREVHPFNDLGEVFTIALVILGAGTVLYNLGLLVEAVTEGNLRQHLERRRMDRQIEEMTGHVIICGFGRVGKAAAEHLVATGNQVVVIDRDIARLADHPGIPHLIGEATGDAILRAAGIARARALVASLDSDAETVYLVLSARALAPGLVIVARARTAGSKTKLVLAGATRAVNPQMIGGRRLAAFALHPDVAEFLDVVVHDEELDFRIEQIRVSAGSPLAGRTIADIDQHAPDVQVLAMRRSGTKTFSFRPRGSDEVVVNCVLIGFGTMESIEALRTLAQG